MNYIAEINAFYTWLLENSIPGNAQALWHRLIAYCNAFGWKDEFTLTNARLVEDLGISRQELDRVRNILCQKGLITYQKGVGNRCGAYHINSIASAEFVSSNQDELNTDDITQNGHSTLHKVDTNATQDDTQSMHLTLPLDKLNKTKQNETKDSYRGGAPKIKTSRFKKPTVEEIRRYCLDRRNNIDAERFYNYYSANGWRVGKNPMKDWKAAVRTWEQNEKSSSQTYVYGGEYGGDKDGDSL